MKSLTKANLFLKIILLVLLLPLAVPVLIPKVGLAYSGVNYELISKEKIIALTFDDGPHPIYTPQILDILDEYQVKATFFMIGSCMEEYPGIVKEVAGRGHLIANHTYTHPDNLRKLSPEELKWEIDQCQQSMQRISGQNNYLFRPPRGILNREIIKILQEKGYTIVLWGVCAYQREAPTPEMMATRVINRAHPGQIVLLHDGRTDFRWKDVAATRLIVENLSQQGYRFVTLEELKPGNKPVRPY